MHNLNLLLRFLLELAALLGFSLFVWGQTHGGWRYPAIAIAVAMIGAIWTTFAVPDDPSRSGNAPVLVPGALRLFLEWLILFGGAWAFHAAGYSWIGLSLTALIVVHYILWPERIAWLLRH